MQALAEGVRSTLFWLDPMFAIVGVDITSEAAAAARTVRLAFQFDLLVSDAASLNVLTKELSQLYTASTQEEGLRLLPAVVTTHREYVLRREVQAAKPKALAAKAKEREYWARKLAAVEDGGLPAAPNLPMAVGPSGGEVQGLSRSSANLGKEQWGRLKAQCRRLSLTPTVCLLAAYASVLATYSSKHFTLTMANFSREAGAEQIVGQLADVMCIEV